MPFTDEERQLRLQIMSEVLKERDWIQAIEIEGGSVLDTHKYTKGRAWWWYSDEGTQCVTAMNNPGKPIYPQGDWHLAATTLDGVIDHDNTIAVAYNILSIRKQHVTHKEEI